MARTGKFNISLRWINSLGGWESWAFQAFNTYGYTIRNAQVIEKDIFENWDTDFIAGTSERENLSMDVNETRVVRSQNLTKQQINAIARIKFSIQVQEISTGRALIVDKSSFQYRTDNDKTHSIEFGVSYPSTLIQSQ